MQVFIGHVINVIDKAPNPVVQFFAISLSIVLALVFLPLAMARRDGKSWQRNLWYMLLDSMSWMEQGSELAAGKVSSP